MSTANVHPLLLGGPCFAALLTLFACTESRFDYALDGTGIFAPLEDCSCTYMPGGSGGFVASVDCSGNGSVWHLVFRVAPGRVFVPMSLERDGGYITSARAEIVVGPLDERRGKGHQDLRPLHLVRVVGPENSAITNIRMTCNDTNSATGQSLGDPSGPVDPNEWQLDPAAGHHVATVSPLRPATIFSLANHPDGVAPGYSIVWLGPGFDLDLSEVDDAYLAFVHAPTGPPAAIATPPANLGRPVAGLPTTLPDQPAFIAENGIALYAADTWRRIPHPPGFVAAPPDVSLGETVRPATDVFLRADGAIVRGAALTPAGLAVHDGAVWDFPAGVGDEVILGPSDTTGFRIIERIGESRICTRVVLWENRPPFLPAADLDSNATCLDARITGLDDNALNGTVDLFQFIATTANGPRLFLFDAALPALDGRAAGTGQLVRGGLEPMTHLEPFTGTDMAIDVSYIPGSALPVIGVARGGRHVGWLNPGLSPTNIVEITTEFWSPNALQRGAVVASNPAPSSTWLLQQSMMLGVARHRIVLDRVALPIVGASSDESVAVPLVCHEAGDVCVQAPCWETCPTDAVCDDNEGFVQCRSEAGALPRDPYEPIAPPDPDEPPDPNEPLEPAGNFFSGRISALIGRIETTLTPLDGGRNTVIATPPDFIFDTDPGRRYRFEVVTTAPDRVVAPAPLEFTTATFGQDLGLAEVRLSAGVVVGGVDAAVEQAPTFIASPTTGTMLVNHGRETSFVYATRDNAIGLGARTVAKRTGPSGEASGAVQLIDSGRLALVADGFADIAIIDMQTGVRVGTVFDVDVARVVGARNGRTFLAIGRGDGKARVFAPASNGWAATGPVFDDGASFIDGGFLVLSPNGRHAGGLVGPDGTPRIIEVASGTTSDLPVVDELGAPLSALAGVDVGPAGIAALRAANGDRIVMQRDAMGWTPVGRCPATALFSFGKSLPVAAWVRADGTLVHTDPAVSVASAALTAAPAKAAGRLAIPTVTGLLVVDIDAATTLNIGGTWNSVTSAPDGAFAALGTPVRQGSGAFTPVLRVSAGNDIFNNTSIYADDRDPENPALRLFGALDVAMAVKGNYIAAGACIGSCAGSALVPIVADATAGGVDFRVANGFTTTLGAWGAPCVPYRRPAAELRLIGEAAGPDVIQCAR